MTIPLFIFSFGAYIIGWFGGHWAGCRETEARWKRTMRKGIARAARKLAGD